LLSGTAFSAVWRHFFSAFWGHFKLAVTGGEHMYIRESKTTNKKTGEVYVKHQLVASVRTEKGPRNKVIMSLGTLAVPRIDWKRLAHAIECRITGQTSLLELLLRNPLLHT
jgi:hypothetical protein